MPRKIKGPKSKKKLVKEREIINSRKKHKQEQGPSLAELNKKVREILKTPAWRTLKREFEETVSHLNQKQS